MIQISISWKSCCLVLAVALVLAIFANGSSGVTAHNGATNKLHGCIGTTGVAGTALNLSGRTIQPETLLRVVDPGQDCAVNELALDWNKELTRTVVVSPVGNATANGQALRDAYANLPAADATNPYLVKLEPGIYDLGSNQLTLKSFVDLEGSGENMTIIRGAGRATPFEGLILGADKTEIRGLTIEVSGGNNAVAIYNSTKTPTIRNVSIRVADASQEDIGIFNFSSKGVTLYNVTISATNGTANGVATGIANSGSNTVINNSSIVVSSTSSVGVTGSTASNVQVYNSSIRSSAVALQATGMSTLRVATSQISGSATANGATITCAYAYNANFVTLGGTCN